MFYCPVILYYYTNYSLFWGSFLWYWEFCFRITLLQEFIASDSNIQKHHSQKPVKDDHMLQEAESEENLSDRESTKNNTFYLGKDKSRK